MKLAGLDIQADDVLEIAQRLRREGFVDVGDRLEEALISGTRRVSFTGDERHCVLRALEDCPAALAELRAVLLEEQARESATAPARQPTRAPRGVTPSATSEVHP